MKKTISKLMLVLLLLPILAADIPNFASNHTSSNSVDVSDFPDKTTT